MRKSESRFSMNPQGAAGILPAEKSEKRPADETRQHLVGGMSRSRLWSQWMRKTERSLEKRCFTFVFSAAILDA
jgi:hypothetical protein